MQIFFFQQQIFLCCHHFRIHSVTFCFEPLSRHSQSFPVPADRLSLGLHTSFVSALRNVWWVLLVMDHETQIVRRISKCVAEPCSSANRFDMVRLLQELYEAAGLEWTAHLHMTAHQQTSSADSPSAAVLVRIIISVSGNSCFVFSNSKLAWESQQWQERLMKACWLTFLDLQLHRFWSASNSWIAFGNCLPSKLHRWRELSWNKRADVPTHTYTTSCIVRQIWW